MSDKELDKIFEKKLSNREFAFNPSNWEAMEAILDAEKGKGAFYWWSSAAILVFGLLVSSLVFIQGDVSNIDSSIENTANTIEREVEPMQIEEVTSSIANEETITTTSEKPNLVEQEETPESDIAVIGSEQTDANEEQAPVNPSVEYVDNVITQPEANSVSANNQEELPVEVKNLPIVSDIDNIFLSYKGISPLQQSENEKFSLFTNRVRPNVIRRYQKQHEFCLQAGPDFSNSIESKNLTTGWLVGMNYQYRFSYTLSLNVAANYSARTSLGVSLSSDSSFIGFGWENIETEVNNNRLDYIEVPIEIAYNINPKHQVGFGAYAGGIFNVNSTINRTHSSTKEADKTTSREENGASENFNLLDFGLTGSYFYQYSPSIAVGAQFKYGLTDITKNIATPLNGNDQNIQTRIILKYRLF